MALKAYGTVGNMDTIHFNKIGEDAGRANAPMAVMEGLAVSLVSGLTFSVAVGRSYQANSIAILDTTPIQKTLGARSSGPRIDRLVLQMDFTKGQDTAATIEIVPGRAVATGSPVSPQLIQDVLTQHKWQVPLARILVPPTGALVITDERPGISNSGSRFSVRAARALTRQLIPASAWTTVLYDRLDRNINDFGGTSIAISGTGQGLFVAPVSGTYQLSGQSHFVNQVGTANTRRQMRLLNRNASGVARWIKNGSNQGAGDNVDVVTVDGTLDLLAGQTVEFQVFQDETKSVYLSDNTSGTGAMGTGDMSYASMTLLVMD